MRKSHLFFFFLLTPPAIFGQYWQQTVNYKIDVSLDDKEHSLDGFEQIEYVNQSPDTLTFIWFHLWPNAYKNDKTAFSEQMLRNGNTRFYFSGKEDRGYINRLDFKVNETTAQTEDHPLYIDVVKVILPEPLPPGERTMITTPFHVKLPFNFSRGGHVGESYQVTQWYPKPAVYDQTGWHPMPYLDQGEFYSDFGRFDVNITVPGNYVVAATGQLDDPQERAWLKTRANFSWEPLSRMQKLKGGSLKKVTQHFPASDARRKTLHFTQDQVHDFAWFADKRFIVLQDTMQLASGKIIEVFSYFTDAEQATWKNSLGYIKSAVRFYSDRVGEYPYQTVSAVQGPESFGGGMEYPTITVISPMPTARLLDRVIAHEVGHNWFYGALASNEREHPWMDEGINSYFEQQYMRYKYQDSTQPENLLLETAEKIRQDQPISTPSQEFSPTNYNLVAYYKTAQWLDMVKFRIGDTAFDRLIRTYYESWKFRHPQPQDFDDLLQKENEVEALAWVALLDKKGILPGQERMGTKVAFPISKEYLRLALHGRYRDLITAGPLFGLNAYDKFMAGLLVTNYKLPPRNFQFFLAPLYATGSSRLNGIGRIAYSFYPELGIRQADIFLNGATFGEDEYTDDDGKKNIYFFRKWVPGFRITFKEPDPVSRRIRYVQWKTFLIGEDGPQFYRDTTISGPDTTIINRYRRVKSHYYINQLKLVVGNGRTLYPYRGELRIEQSTDFVRAAFEGEYFFNYAKKGGLNLRLFAGKFFYLGEKTFSSQFRNDRFHLNMTGANGYEDYTYSDYFIGRNKFEGLPSQQIMVRDGGFKVRTDLLSNKIGKTDDWLIAINLTSTIPDNLNILNLLPVKIPLRAFVDIGTYSDAWKPNSGVDRFLFDAGLQVSLFKNTVNVYVPLIYSKIFKDYIKSTLPQKGRLLKTVSFSLDISHFTVRKFARELFY